MFSITIAVIARRYNGTGSPEISESVTELKTNCNDMLHVPKSVLVVSPLACVSTLILGSLRTLVCFEIGRSIKLVPLETLAFTLSNLQKEFMKGPEDSLVSSNIG